MVKLWPLCVPAGERLPPQCHQRSVHQDVSDAQWKRSGDRRHPGRTPRPAGPPEIWIFPLKTEKRRYRRKPETQYLIWSFFIRGRKGLYISLFQCLTPNSFFYLSLIIIFLVVHSLKVDKICALCFQFGWLEPKLMTFWSVYTLKVLKRRDKLYWTALCLSVPCRYSL